MGRLLGVDYGDVRIGLALSDPMHVICSPHDVVQHADNRSSAREIVRICEEQDVELIVVGLPLNMDGSSGAAVEKVMAFVKQFKKLTDIPVITWDERMTTITAQQALIEGNVRREKRKLHVDKLAAQIMLQHYMDSTQE